MMQPQMAMGPTIYNPYPVGPITQRSQYGGSYSVPQVPHDLEEKQAHPEPAPARANPAPAAPPAKSPSLAPLYAAVCLVLLVTIPTLGLASYAVDRLNRTFLPKYEITSSAVTSSEMSATAKENFKKWNDALQTRDYAKVAGLYATSELSFLPTVSPKFIQDTTNTQDYFKKFLLNLPFGTITEDQTQAFGSDAYLHSGMYTFQLGPLDNRSNVEARFSYVWRKIDGEWKITHHHSSVKPSGRRSASLQAEAESVASFVVFANPEAAKN